MRVIVKEILAVAIGGGLGSVCRFGLSRWVNFTFRHQDFPWGIWACNVLGSFAIGILAGLLVYRYDVGPFWRAGLIIGLLGGFTTFSSFSLDTVTLFQQGDIMLALANVVGSLLVCLLATAAGIWLVT